MATPRQPGLKDSPSSRSGDNLDTGVAKKGDEHREGFLRKGAENASAKTPYNDPSRPPTSTEFSASSANQLGPEEVKEYKGAEFRAVDVARDGKSMRVRFATLDGEIGLSLTPDNFRGMMGILLRAEAQRYKNAGIPDELRAFAATDATVSVSRDGKHLGITMILPGDQGRFGFQVDRQIARGLMRILAAALGESTSPTKPH